MFIDFWRLCHLNKNQSLDTTEKILRSESFDWESCYGLRFFFGFISWEIYGQTELSIKIRKPLYFYQIVDDFNFSMVLLNIFKLDINIQNVFFCI